MERVRIRMHPHRRYVSENSEPQIGMRRDAPGQPYGAGMTEDEGYRLVDDGTEEPEDCDEDSFDSRIAVLRDIMDGYDWSFLLDVRDPLFVSRLREALGFLGLAMEMRAGPPVGEGRFFRSDAEIVLCMGDERMRYRASHVSSDPSGAVLASARGVFEAAGLMRRPDPPGDGMRMSFRP